MKIDDNFIVRWSQYYEDDASRSAWDREHELLAEVTPAVQSQGYFTQEQLLKVVRWKASRSQGYVMRNPAQLVERVTSLALSHVVDERATTLCALEGVNIRMASAILTVWAPDRYTVMDVNAIGTLIEAGHDDIRWSRWPYGLYLEKCHSLIANSMINDARPSVLRLLDRALWKYTDKDGVLPKRYQSVHA